MTPVPIGTRIQIVSNSNRHHYRTGGIYRVHQVDTDGTLKAIDEMGVEGDFLQWDDCKPVGIGWKWIRGHLDARSLDLLGAFDGLDNLSLRQDVETKVISTIPNLADQILAILPEVEERTALMASAAADDDTDLDLEQLLTS
jgi:hypothetical protein